MNLDLESINTPASSEAGHEIELMYNGQPCGWFVTVRGEYAPSVKKWQLGVGNQFRIKEWQERSKSGKDGAPPVMTEADMEIGLRGAAVRVAAWRGVMFAGQPFPCNEANAYELVRRHPPFADQILEASANIALFTSAQ